MSQPIYSLYMVKPTDAWYMLSDEEQGKIFEKVNQALKDVGGESILQCRSSWSSERWPYFGLERFPDEAALQKHSELLEGFNWFRYSVSQTLLGVSQDLIEPVAANTGGIFKVAFGRPLQAYYALDAQQRQHLMDNPTRDLDRVGGKNLLYCDVFSSERYLGFIIEHYPSLEAEIEYTRCLREMDWYQYIDADILLGTQTA